MLRVTYKVSDVFVDSTSFIFVPDSVDGSIDSVMSDIVIESNYSIYFSDKWYLWVFDTAIFLAETLENLLIKVLLKDIRSLQTFISLLSWK